MERAWELSGHHYARAKRHLGDFLYEKNQFAECIPHYKEAVSGGFELFSAVFFCLWCGVVCRHIIHIIILTSHHSLHITHFTSLTSSHHITSSLHFTSLHHFTSHHHSLHITSLTPHNSLLTSPSSASTCSTPTHGSSAPSPPCTSGTTSTPSPASPPSSSRTLSSARVGVTSPAC